MRSSLIAVLLAVFIIYSCPAYASRESLVFSGRKTFAWNEEQIQQGTLPGDATARFEQTFRFAMSGMLHDGIRTDLRFDDTLPSKVEKLEFQWAQGPWDLTVGDFSLEPHEFRIPESRLRGLHARWQEGESNASVFISRPDNRLVTDLIRGRGERGPYYLSSTRLVAESETLHRRGMPLIRNLDYVIDTQAGVVEFTNPLAWDEQVEVTARAQNLGTDVRPDQLLALQSETVFGSGNQLNLELLHREDDNENSGRQHTQLVLAQKLKLTERLDLEARVDHSQLESDTTGRLQDQRLALRSRYNLGLMGIGFQVARAGDQYVPVYGVADERVDRMGVFIDRERLGLLQELRFSRVDGDSLGTRDELDGRLEYARDSRLRLAGNYRLRRPTAGEDMDSLTDLHADLNLHGIKVENRLTMQDGLTAFNPDGDVEGIRDGECRITTSPRRRTVYMLEGRRVEEDRSGTMNRSRDESRLRVLHRISAATQWRTGLSMERRPEENDRTRELESIITHRFHPRLTMDSRLYETAREGVFPLTGRGMQLGLRWNPLPSIRVTSDLGARKQSGSSGTESPFLFQEDVKLLFDPSGKIALELNARQEDLPVSGLGQDSENQRREAGGRVTLRLTPQMKLRSDLLVSADRVPQRRERLSWNAELIMRLPRDMDFSLSFSKLSTEFPDESKWDTMTTKGGFRLEARI